MGIFDIFSNSDAQQAANDQISGINQGLTAATGDINQGIGALNTNYTAALQPFLNNYSTAGAGVTQLKNLLGLNGANGSQTALNTLNAMPGYRFALNQGDNAINAAAAANGTLNSGNQLTALSNFNQGLASQNYNNYVSNLMPFLGASESAASGIGGIDTGLGNKLANQYGSLANLNWQAATNKGNAQANADLAKYNASGNLFNAASAGISDALMLFSDVRLKENIEPVGELYDGTNVYRYNYKGDHTPRIGVMAQEVERTRPDAVAEVGGFKAVDYGKATDLAAKLARFVDGDNVIGFDERAARKTGGFTDGLDRFLKAA